MKIRPGFVSNSSSSSFIVTFPEAPTSKEHLAEMMGDCSVQGAYTESLTSEQVVDNVWRDIQATSNKKDFLSLLVRRGISHYDTDDILKLLAGVDFTEFLNEREYSDNPVVSFAELRKLLNAGLDKLEKGFADNVFHFEYEDSSSYWAAMEHGDIFRNLPHEVISHH